jgi:hypothetical protein
LDLKFLDTLIRIYDIELDFDEILFFREKLDNINIFIFEAYLKIKDKFMEENKEEIKCL